MGSRRKAEREAVRLQQAKLKVSARKPSPGSLYSGPGRAENDDAVDIAMPMMDRFRRYLETTAIEEGVVDYDRFRDTVARLPISQPTLEDLKSLWPYLPNMLLERFLVPGKPEYAEMPGGELSLNYQQVVAQIPSLRVDGVALSAAYVRKTRLLDLIEPTTRPYEIEEFAGGRTMECDYEEQAVAYARDHWPSRLIVGEAKDYVAFVLVDDFDVVDDEIVPSSECTIHCALSRSFDEYAVSSQLMPKSQEFFGLVVESSNVDYVGYEYRLAHMKKTRHIGINSSSYKIKELFVCGACGGAIDKDGCTYCNKVFVPPLNLAKFTKHWGAPLPPPLADQVTVKLLLTADQRTQREYALMADEVSEYVRMAMNNARKKALEEVPDMTLRDLVDQKVGHADTKVTDDGNPSGIRIGAGSRMRHVALGRP